MRADERQAAIVSAVNERGSISIREFAEEIGVAAVTLRVDVRELARRGLIRRVHGGATRASAPDHGAAPANSDGSSVVASGVVTARTGDATFTLGMVVPHASYYYPAVVEGAKAAADELGARLLLAVSRNTVNEERAQVAQLLRSGVDGLILTTIADPGTSQETRDWLAGIPVPVVLAERRIGLETDAVEHVATDHEHGAYLAVRHLAEQGRRRIGLVSLDTRTAPRLRQGYEAALDALGLRATSPDVGEVLQERDERAFDEACEKLAGDVREGSVDAVIIHNDSLAIPMVSRLRADGIEVPGDLAIMAYDDELASLADPPLSAVAPPRAAVGAEAVTLLVQRLADPARPQHYLMLRGELRVRLSCGSEAEVGAREPDADLVIS